MTSRLKKWMYDGKLIHILYDADHDTYCDNGISDGINLKNPHASACGTTINKIASAKLIMISMQTFHVQ